MTTIEIQKLDLENHLSNLTLDDFKKIENFYFEEGDFEEYPNSLNVAKRFWGHKNIRKSSAKPYEWLELSADYAAVVFMKNHPDFETDNGLRENITKIVEKTKLFVEAMSQKPGYKLSDFFKPLACEVNEEMRTTSEKIKNIID